MSEIKFCKDCRHCKTLVNLWCENPHIKREIDLTTGDIIISPILCSI